MLLPWYSSIPIHFVPIQASYLSNYKEFIVYNDKVYNNFYDLIKGYKAIDFSLVKDKNKFRKESAFLYTDGVHKYEYNYKDKIIKPVTWLEGLNQWYPRIKTYNYLGNIEMYASPTQLIFSSYNQKSKPTYTPHISALKNLTLAIAFDDKLLIENNVIKNIANREAMSFLGSTVKVISPCDGGRGPLQTPLKCEL